MALEDKKVLVLGGGIAGVTAALDLAQAGTRVVLVEKEEAIGGQGAHLACMALDRCQKCNGCLVEPRLAKALAHPGLTLMTGTEMAKVEREGNGFQISLESRPNRGATELRADSLVLATGYTPFQAREKSRYGYGRFENVATVLELDAELRQTGQVLSRTTGRPPETAAFIQCVGSRDATGNNYCSRICCGFAIRLGRMLKNRFGTQVTIFYMDIQNFGHVFETTLAAAKAELNLVRAMPSDIFPGEEGRVIVQHYPDPEAPPVDQPFDMLILSIGLAPGEDNQSLAGLLGLDLDRHGFFQDGPPAGQGKPEAGIFLAGTAVRPMDVAEAVAHAQRAAQETISFLEGN